MSTLLQAQLGDKDGKRVAFCFVKIRPFDKDLKGIKINLDEYGVSGKSD